MFTDGAGEPLSRHQWPRTAFRPAVAAALGRSDIRVHDLRHSYASWLVQAGVGLYQISALLGHTDPAITATYAHLGPDAFGPSYLPSTLIPTQTDRLPTYAAPPAHAGGAASVLLSIRDTRAASRGSAQSSAAHRGASADGSPRR